MPQARTACPDSSGKYGEIAHRFDQVEVQYRPLPKRKWPLTHKERISELRSSLLSDQFEYDHQNIHVAIRYHESFDPDSWCGGNFVYFSRGKSLTGASSVFHGGQSRRGQRARTLST